MARSRLQRELKQNRPFDTPEQEAVLNVLRTGDRFQNRMGRLFREHGLTLSQYNVLRILRGAGEPLSCQAIGERMVQVVPAITGLVDRLESAGLVKRERCSEDRRVVYVSLTEEGQRVLRSLDAPVKSLHRELIGHLTRRELKQLSGLLEKARAPLTAETD